MFLFIVSVKWQKELFQAVEIDTSQPAYVFKCQLYDLTGVPPERQKIMVKGGLLKVSRCLCRCCLKLIHILICSNIVHHTVHLQ